MNEYHYTESGLDNVWLVNGFEVFDTEFGEGVAIHNLDGLHVAIGKAILAKPVMNGKELRFIRKEMGLSQNALAIILGTTVQSVAKWEKTGRVPKTADRMTRLFYLEHVDGNVAIRETLEQLNDTDNQEHERLLVEESATGWKIAA